MGRTVGLLLLALLELGREAAEGLAEEEGTAVEEEAAAGWFSRCGGRSRSLLGLLAFCACIQKLAFRA